MGKTKIVESQPIDIYTLKAQIRAAIQKKYGMNVSEFSRTEDAARILGKGAKNLSVYLSTGEVTSFPVLKKLAEEFGFGSLTKQTIVDRKVVYTYENS